MPKVERQSPPRTEAQLPQGSLLTTAVSVTKLREEWIKVCWYGRNRSGKTTLFGELAKAMYAKYGKPSLLISSEPDANGGALSVADAEHLMLIRVSNRLLGQDRDGRWLDAEDKRCVRKDKLRGSAKLIAIANELLEIQKAGNECPFAAVGQDTVTSMQDVILTELMNLPKVPEMMSWGFVPDGMYQQRAEKLRETIRPLLDLRDCHVVILAQEKDHNAMEDRGGRNKILHTMQQGSFMAPALGATNAQWLQDACGYVVQIYEDEVTKEVVIPVPGSEPIVQQIGTGARQRHLRLLYHPNFAAGGRWQFDRSVPEFVTAPTPSELYAAMAKFIPSLGG